MKWMCAHKNYENVSLLSCHLFLSNKIKMSEMKFLLSSDHKNSKNISNCFN